MNPSTILVEAKPALDPKEYAGVVLVTGIMIVQMYVFMQLGGTSKMVKTENPKKSQIQWASRAFGNFNEQFPLIVSSLWLHAVFMSPHDAMLLGYAYIGFRTLYPIVWALSGTFNPPGHLGMVTVPMYGIVTYLTVSTVLQVYWGIDVNSHLGPIPLLFGPMACCGVLILNMMGMMGVNNLVYGLFEENSPDQIEILQEQFDEQLPLIQNQAAGRGEKNGGCCPGFA